MLKKACLTAAAATMVLTLYGCEPESQGPMERAGEKIDDAAEKVGENMEEAGEEMQKKSEGE